jgi:tripartite-type tricarboxylate transporter receptor subunit TctC
MNDNATPVRGRQLELKSKGRNIMRVLKAFVAAILVTAAWTCPAMAQNYPDKPVKVILPFPAGTGPDAVMRQVADKLTRWWGQPVTIDNRPGAHGWTAVEAAKKSAPDGYTMLQIDNLLFALQPHVFRSLPFDPIKDFEPVSPLYSTHYFVTVAANSSWNKMSDLVAAANSPLIYPS